MPHAFALRIQCLHESHWINGWRWWADFSLFSLSLSLWSGKCNFKHMNLNILFAFSTCFCRQIFEFTFYDFSASFSQKIVVKRYGICIFNRIRFERIENCTSSTHENHMFFCKVSLSFSHPHPHLHRRWSACAFIPSLYFIYEFFLTWLWLLFEVFVASDKIELILSHHTRTRSAKTFQFEHSHAIWWEDTHKIKWYQL